MDSLLILFLIWSLLIYVLGAISGLKNFSFIEFIKKAWLDLFYFLFVILISAFIVESFWSDNPQNTVQILIFIITAAALIYQGLVAKIFRDYINRPIINVKFDDNYSDYYHQTIMRYGVDDTTGNKAVIEYLPTYYIRLKIKNEGKSTLENVEVVLESVEPKPEIFMSLNLSWAGFIDPFGDIKRTIRIPQGSSRVVDIIEVPEPTKTKAFSQKLENDGGWNEEGLKRLKKFSTGFRSCSIKPNTLSDIFLAGNYVFRLGIYADGAEPIFRNLSIEYSGDWGTEGVDGMRSKYLKVKLLNCESFWRWGKLV